MGTLGEGPEVSASHRVHPQPSATLAHFCLFLAPSHLSLPHTSPQVMRTTWGIIAAGPSGTSLLGATPGQPLFSSNLSFSV